MKDSLFITGYGYVDENGYGRGEEASSWAENDAQNPFDAIWSKMFDVPYDRFGRLDAPGKCACIAAELSGLTVASNNGSLEDTAIVMGTCIGCLDTDIAFLNSLTADSCGSPRLFSYTLTSTILGEIAIRYGIKGQNICFCCEQNSLTLALREGIALILSGEALRCLCLSVDVLSSSISDMCTCASINLGIAPIFSARCLIIEKNSETQADVRKPMTVIRLAKTNNVPIQFQSDEEIHLHLTKSRQEENGGTGTELLVNID